MASRVYRIPKPDLVEYLDVYVDEQMRRIKERGRPYEVAIPRVYLENLSRCYEEHMDQLGTEVRRVEVVAGESPDEVAGKAAAIARDVLATRSEAEHP